MFFLYFSSYLFAKSIPILNGLKNKQNKEHPIIVHLLRLNVNKCDRKLANETFILYKLIIYEQ